MKGDTMKNDTLHRLWIGDVTPQQDQRTNTPQIKQLVADMNELRTQFCSDMTAEQLQAFIKFDALQTEMFALLEEQAFIQGVCLGGNLIHEILG
jgi:hypothetical protein